MEQLPLKDIHLPETVSWWPPAPGWYLLPLCIIAAAFFYKTALRQNTLKTAGKMLAAIRNEEHRDSLQKLSALSSLLRRVALSTTPRTEVAGLNGEAWLAYLDASFQDKPFSSGIGRCLADGHYRPSVPADADLDALFKLCERWLKQQKTSRFSLPMRNVLKQSKIRPMQGATTESTGLRGNND